MRHKIINSCLKFCREFRRTLLNIKIKNALKYTMIIKTCCHRSDSFIPQVSDIPQSMLPAFNMCCAHLTEIDFAQFWEKICPYQRWRTLLFA